MCCFRGGGGGVQDNPRKNMYVAKNMQNNVGETRNFTHVKSQWFFFSSSEVTSQRAGLRPRLHVQHGIAPPPLHGGRLTFLVRY